MTSNALRILVVDDEDIVRYTIEAMLNHLGHHANSVGDGLTGLQELEKDNYDAAIVDIRMPGIDGVRFLSLTREMRPGLPVIVVSGHASPEIMEEALLAGAFAFLSKPFRLDDIEALMKKIIPLEKPS